MQNVFAFSTSARFAVIEFIDELSNERVTSTQRIPENRRERYQLIKAKYDADPMNAFYNLTSDEFWFMESYEDEQWRNSEDYQELLEWLADPANRSSENYSDIFKDVYGVRPR